MSDRQVITRVDKSWDRMCSRLILGTHSGSSGGRLDTSARLLAYFVEPGLILSDPGGESLASRYDIRVRIGGQT